MPRRESEQQPEGHREEPSGGFEDPAQRPASERPGPGSADRPDRDERQGRWPQSSLFVGVIVLLFGGLVVLGILGFLASR